MALMGGSKEQQKSFNAENNTVQNSEREGEEGEEEEEGVEEEDDEDEGEEEDDMKEVEEEVEVGVTEGGHVRVNSSIAASDAA